MSLDITSPISDIRDFVKAVLEKVHSVDILVNNAGFAMQGAVEEIV